MEWLRTYLLIGLACVAICFIKPAPILRMLNADNAPPAGFLIFIVIFIVFTWPFFLLFVLINILRGK